MRLVRLLALGLFLLIALGVSSALEKQPGMVFTIEPGVYIPEEKLGVRIECDFLVLPDGKLLDLDAGLPHSVEEVESAMRK